MSGSDFVLGGHFREREWVCRFLGIVQGWGLSGWMVECAALLTLEVEILYVGWH